MSLLLSEKRWDRRFSSWSLVVGMVLGLAWLAGCERADRVPRRMAQRGATTIDSGVLVQAVASQLANLPEASIVELSPPQVILDARRSRDGQDVLAQLTQAPGTKEPFYNRLVVTSGNSRFRSLGVQPGDVVKYYAIVKSDMEEAFGADARGEDILITEALELRVAQVPNETTLIIEGGLPVGLEVPTRMEVWRYSDHRLRDLSLELSRYAQNGVPRLGWEPSPDVQTLEQIVERLNQWLRQATPEVDWHPAALVDSLPEGLRHEEVLQPFLSPQALERSAFSLPTEEERTVQALAYEGRLLQEATWARDISLWAGGAEFDAALRVEQLFDWTVRNLWLEEAADGGEEPPLPYRPWQAMLHAHATAEGRAWVFAQLCRQQRVPVVILRSAAGQSVPVPAAGNAESAADSWWCCGALVGEQLYLYDPRLGLPLRDKAGQVATLAQLREEPSLLRQWDLPDTPYPADGEAVEQLVAEVVAGPFALTRRVAQLEQQLTGDEALVLSVDVDQLAKRLRGIDGISEVRLWEHPYRTLLQQLTLKRRQRTLAAIESTPYVHKPLLWKARLLHFRGWTRDGSDDHVTASGLYLHPRVRPINALIERLAAEDIRRAWRAAKQQASYCVGLLSSDKGRSKVALEWFEQVAPTSREQDEVSQLVGGWRSLGVAYNKARALEQLDDAAEAISLLRSDGQPVGSRLRAEQLEQTISGDQTTTLDQLEPEQTEPEEASAETDAAL